MACLCGTPQAAERPRVLLAVPPRSGPLLAEALIRIRGELGAVGLQVEVQAQRLPGEDGSARSDTSAGAAPFLGASDYGAIVLTEQGGMIEIRAFAPGLETPVSQSASPHHPGVDAEVVAVRAVEALRAAMIQYARNLPPQQSDLPAEVSEFTRLGPSPPGPVGQTRDASPPDGTAFAPGETPSPPEQNAREREQERPWTVRMGALGALESPAGKSAVGVQGAVTWQPGWAGVALTGQRSLGGPQVSEPEGRALLERSAAYAALSLRPSLTARTDLRVTLGVGVVHFAARPEAAEGFAGRGQTHLSPAWGLQLAGAQWLSERVGLYGALGGEWLFDAPRFRFDGRDVAVVGRPTATLGAGLLFGL